MPKVKRNRRKRTSSKAAKDVVPYARGFAPPTAKRREKALSVRTLKPELARLLLPKHDELFVPVPPPTSIDDWLAQYNEEGQTCAQFLADCPWLSSRKMPCYKSMFIPNGKTITKKYPRGKIYILPLNSDMDPPTEIAPDFNDLADYAERFYGIPVRVLPPIELRVDKERQVLVWENDPANTEKPSSYRKKLRRKDISIRFHEKTGHFQLHAVNLLGKFREIVPEDALVLMALTRMDIYLDESDLFVAGLAGGNTRVGIFSLKRYDPSLTFSTEHWYDITTTVSHKASSSIQSKETSKKLMLQRSIKLLVHEIAHLLGLDHCIWYSCCMNGSGHLTEDFRQSMHLCPVDLCKLQHLCGFDILQRYSKLRDFFAKHHLEEEKTWVEKRVKSIT